MRAAGYEFTGFWPRHLFSSCQPAAAALALHKREVRGVGPSPSPEVTCAITMTDQLVKTLVLTCVHVKDHLNLPIFLGIIFSPRLVGDTALCSFVHGEMEKSWNGFFKLIFVYYFAFLIEKQWHVVFRNDPCDTKANKASLLP